MIPQGARARTHQTSLESPGERILHCDRHFESGPQQAVVTCSRLSGEAVGEQNPPRFDGSKVGDLREVSLGFEESISLIQGRTVVDSFMREESERDDLLFEFIYAMEYSR